MSLLSRIIVGLLVATVGALMVIKTRKFLEFFGPVGWAEQHLGGGGSSLFYKLLGIAVCFIGFMVATNLWYAFLEATLGSLFGMTPNPGA